MINYGLKEDLIRDILKKKSSIESQQQIIVDAYVSYIDEMHISLKYLLREAVHLNYIVKNEDVHDYFEQNRDALAKITYFNWSETAKKRIENVKTNPNGGYWLPWGCPVKFVAFVSNAGEKDEKPIVELKDPYATLYGVAPYMLVRDLNNLVGKYVLVHALVRGENIKVVQLTELN